MTNTFTILISTYTPARVSRLVMACILFVGLTARSPAAEAEEQNNKLQVNPVTESSRSLPNPVYTIEAIEIRGDIKMDEQLLLKLMGVFVGETADAATIKMARNQLLATGYFTEVVLSMKKGSKRGYVIVKVSVDERNTLLLSDIFLGVSSSTPFWGGLEIMESNLAGKGLSLIGGFVISENQSSYRIGLRDPFFFSLPISFLADFKFSDAREKGRFRDISFMDSGVVVEPFFIDFLTAGGKVGIGFFPSLLLGIFVDYRFEWIGVDSAQPAHTTGMLQNGNSYLSTLKLIMELDTRDDPFLPKHGFRVNLAMEGSHSGIGSSYEFLKFTLQAAYNLELAEDHVLRFDIIGGYIFGNPPFFDRYFAGDVSDLVPSRNLGLNFSNRPSVNLLGLGADQLSYETAMVRGGLEYAISIMKGSGWLYSAEFFISFGAFAMGSIDDAPVILGIDSPRGPQTGFPVDLTFDLGLRVDTMVGVFGLSFGNGLALIPF